MPVSLTAWHCLPPPPACTCRQLAPVEWTNSYLSPSPSHSPSHSPVMAGQLVMLTPVASPAVTQPPSPTSPSPAGEPTTWFSEGRPAPRAAAGTAVPLDGLQEVAAQDVAGSTIPTSTCSSSPASPPAHAKWRSPPCCDGCGAAKASAGQCTGCGGRFCASCMGNPAGISSVASAASSNNGSPSAAGGSSAAAAGRAAGGAEPCNNCSSLCNSCKPVTCW